MNRTKKVVSIIILIAALLIIKEVVAFFPYFMMGAPFGVFGIMNRDSIDHSVNVQVFDPGNKLLLNETYDLGPSQSAQYPEYVRDGKNGWKDYHEKDRLFPDGNYRFIITLDNNITETYQGIIDTWSSAHIEIDENGNIQIGRITG